MSTSEQQSLCILWPPYRLVYAPSDSSSRNLSVKLSHMFRSVWQLQEGILDEKWTSMVPRVISCISSWAMAHQCLGRNGHDYMIKDHRASKARKCWLGWNFLLRCNVTPDLHFRIFIGLHHSDKRECEIHRARSVTSARYQCCVCAKLLSGLKGPRMLFRVKTCTLLFIDMQ